LQQVIYALNGCLKEYTLSSAVAVYKSMLQFKGSSSKKQYKLMKPVKGGYEVLCLTDSGTGFVIHFDTRVIPKVMSNVA